MHLTHFTCIHLLGEVLDLSVQWGSNLWAISVRRRSWSILCLVILCQLVEQLSQSHDLFVPGLQVSPNFFLNQFRWKLVLTCIDLLVIGSDEFVAFSALKNVFGCISWLHVLPLLRILMLWEKLKEVMNVWIYESSQQSHSGIVKSRNYN